MRIPPFPSRSARASSRRSAATETTDNLKLSEWLHARTEADPVTTVLGPFAWDERGLPLNRPFLEAQWQDGELRFVYPTDEFEGVAALDLSEARMVAAYL